MKRLYFLELFFSLIGFLNAKQLFVVSLFRHSNRSNYIDFSKNKRNEPKVTEEGLKNAFEKGRDFIKDFPFKRMKSFKGVNINNTLCYKGKKFRTYQTLLYRLYGMTNDTKSLEESIASEPLNITTIENSIRLRCSPIERELIFPSNLCEKKMQEILLTNFDFVHYGISLLNKLKYNEIFSKYYNSDIFFDKNGELTEFYRLHLTNDYFQNKKELTEEEKEIKETLKDYRVKYLNSFSISEILMRTLSDRFLDIVVTELENKVTFYSKYKYLLFSGKELDILSVVKTLEIEGDEEFKYMFNDAFNIVLSKKKGEYYVSFYYNLKQVKMKKCELLCPFEKFKKLLFGLHGNQPKGITEFCEGKISYYQMYDREEAGEPPENAESIDVEGGEAYRISDKKNDL